MRRFVTLLFLISLGNLFQPAVAYTLHGQLKNYSSKWGNKLYLAAIRTSIEFHSASFQMEINETVLDKSGNFTISGVNLPDELAFYRVFICEKGVVGFQFLNGPNHNYIHLLLNNKSDVTINVDLATTPFYLAFIKGAPYSGEFADYYNKIQYIQKQRYTNPYTQISLDGQKAFQLTKQSIVKNDNPYYTIFALSCNDLIESYASDPAFFDKTIIHLKKQLPGNSYVNELENKYQLTAFRLSPFKPYLNTSTFIALISIICILLIINVYQLWFAFRKNRKVPVVNISEDTLTPKEFQIARLVINGKSNKEISALLFIELSTVKSHIGNIYKKLDISDRKELANRLT